jgi:hypothetical protein
MMCEACQSVSGEPFCPLAASKKLFLEIKLTDKRKQAMPSNTLPVITTTKGIDKEHISLSAATKWLSEVTGTKCCR